MANTVTPKMLPDGNLAHYTTQVVFLTGATGGLGACLMHKLATQLPTKKIYVLVRDIDKAKQTWKDTMPDQITSITESGKVVLVVGDILKHDFGMVATHLAEIAEQTTTIVHCAASTSFSLKLADSVRYNTLSSLELARLASRFNNLQHFIQVSSAFCNSNLPDGLVEEKIYPLGDPEIELQQILGPEGTTEFASKFPFPYGYAKNLTERLLFSQFPNLPILIVRPSSIGSSVRDPYPLYGPPGAVPLEKFFQLMTFNPGSGIMHAPEGHSTGCNVYDDIPMDWVANLILLHCAAGTKGVVHAVAESYVPCTMDYFISAYMEPSAAEKITFVKDNTISQCRWATYYGVMTRDLDFSNASSKAFEAIEGPLSISIKNHDKAAFDRKRKEKIMKGVQEHLEVKRLRSRLESKSGPTDSKL